MVRVSTSVPLSQNRKQDNQNVIERLLSENLVYLRALTASITNPRAKNAIDTLQKAAVYKYLNGNRTHHEIARLMGLPRETVRNWIREFVGCGIVTLPNKCHSSHKALFNLDELDIDLDSLRNRSKKRQTKQDSRR